VSSPDKNVAGDSIARGKNQADPLCRVTGRE